MWLCERIGWVVVLVCDGKGGEDFETGNLLWSIRVPRLDSIALIAHDIYTPSAGMRFETENYRLPLSSWLMQMSSTHRGRHCLGSRERWRA